MRKIISISFILPFLLNFLQAQDLPRLISTEICHCIDTIENMDSLDAKLDRCFPDAIDAVIGLLDENMQELFYDEGNLNKIMDEVYEKFLSYCPKVRKFILEDKERNFYKMSDSPEAREYFEAGNKAFDSKDYKTAIKFFLKAIKADTQWVLPYDNLGLTYRTTGNYQKAIKYYGKSLQKYPEGRIALQNQAVAYTYLNDFLHAMNNYDQLIHLYPENPEGYFGTALISFMIKDYERALEFALYSHKMYVSSGSENKKDSESLISAIFEKMKEQGKDSVFYEKAKQFGINIIQN